MDNNYNAGTTVWLTANFVDRHGVAADPTSLTLTITDSQNTLLETITPIGSFINDSTGCYVYGYETEATPKEYTCKFTAVIGTYPDILKVDFRTE
jgi:hypothetical protein